MTSAGEMPADPKGFDILVKPFLKNHCLDCHDTETHKGGVDLSRFTTPSEAASDWELWTKIGEQLHLGAMPPKNKPQPAPAERAAVSAWIASALEAVARADAGAPGAVPLRHLTNGEFDAAIEDLTGVDYGFGEELPSDIGGGEGFTNAAGGQQFSSVHLSSWMNAAKRIADACEVLPSGLRFSSNEVGIRETASILLDCQNRQRQFYRQYVGQMLPDGVKDLRLKEYLVACWRHRHAAAIGRSSDLKAVAAETKLDPAFLRNWWTLLSTTEPKSHHLDLTRHAFAALPGPGRETTALPAEVEAGIDAIVAERTAWIPMQRAQQDVDGIRPTELTSPIKPEQRIAWLAISEAGDDAKGDVVKLVQLRFGANKNNIKALDHVRAWLEKPPGAATAEEIAAVRRTLGAFGKHPNQRPIKPEELIVQAPIAVAIPLPPGISVMSANVQLDIQDPETDEGTFQAKLASDQPTAAALRIMPGVTTYALQRGKKAGWNKCIPSFNQMRQCFPDTRERRLNRLEENVTTDSPFLGVYWLSDQDISDRLNPGLRAGFTALRDDTATVRLASGNRMRSKVKAAEKDGKILPVTELAKLEQERDDALKRWDQSALDACLRLAARAWRLPLDTADGSALTALYRAERSAGRDIEPAARVVIARILASPRFVLRREPSSAQEHPLDGWAMASRLSFFLWSSIPDEALRADAAAGRLDSADGVAATAKRMLADPKASRLAHQFFAQWLRIQGFAKAANPDPVRFPEFTPAIRQALYDETITFCADLIARNGDVRDLIYGKHTFVTPDLARYYGMKPARPGMNRVDGGPERGGILGMGSILTRTSYPLRTSPVLRGNFLIEVVLGTPTPPPPPNVPQLPNDEKVSDGISLRQRLERHRADPVCASCHDRIDPLGFALERFDAIGRSRSADANGLAIDDSGTATDGSELRGLAGLRQYLMKPEPQRQFLTQFATKLLGFALARPVQATDRPLIRDLTTASATAADAHRIGRYIEAIVTSRQFRFRASESGEQSTP